jgi:hypothetical protein
MHPKSINPARVASVFPIKADHAEIAREELSLQIS